MRSVPLLHAVPVYGFVLPAIVAVTLVTNSFIVIVLSQKHLRTPTNYVLLAMALAELCTGLVSTPWFLYYYTLGGWRVDEYQVESSPGSLESSTAEGCIQGLPSLWCTAFPYLAYVIPTICHTAAIWLTVYLAVQRYVYVCVPSKITL